MLQRHIGVLLVAALFAFLYAGYPFDGMILSDSWYFYASDGGAFTWYTKAHLVYRERVDNPLEVGVYTPGWSALVTTRGLIPVVAWAIHGLAGGAAASVNALAVVVLLLNLALFGYVVGRLAGPRWLVPAVLVAALYPFAAGSHFWQFLIVNNLAATFFLGSLALFVSLEHVRPRPTPGWLAGAALTLAGLWISLLIVNYATFMGPLYVYLALYLANERRTALRFARWRTPATWLALACVALNVLAVVLFSRDAASFLVYAPRFQEVAARVGVPTAIVAVGVVAANATLTYLSMAVANTVGLLLYPLHAVVAHGHVLLESGQHHDGLIDGAGLPRHLIRC